MKLDRGYLRYSRKTNISFKIQQHVSWERKIGDLMFIWTFCPEFTQTIVCLIFWTLLIKTLYTISFQHSTPYSKEQILAMRHEASHSFSIMTKRGYREGVKIKVGKLTFTEIEPLIGSDRGTSAATITTINRRERKSRGICRKSEVYYHLLKDKPTAVTVKRMLKRGVCSPGAKYCRG